MGDFDFNLGKNLHFRTSGENLDRFCLKIVDSTLCCDDEDEKRVTENDPNNSFVPIEEIADESIDYNYPEVFGIAEQPEEVVVTENFSLNATEPTLIEDKCHFGRIACAFADAKTGCIILFREKEEEVVKKEIETDDNKEHFYSYTRRKNGKKNYRASMVVNEQF